MCALPHQASLYHKLARYVIVIDKLASRDLQKPSRSQFHALHLLSKSFLYPTYKVTASTARLNYFIEFPPVNQH